MSTQEDGLHYSGRERLISWFRLQLPGADDVRIDGLDRIVFGYSAEMLALTLRWRIGGRSESRDVVLRLRPPFPGLLEPYDLDRQFTILRALEATVVRAPKPLWLEETGGVLGRPFYAMERLAGEAFERGIPPDLEAAPDRIRRMSQSMVEQIAAIHLVDLPATGLQQLPNGRGYLDRELDHWSGEMNRVARGPLPALERLILELREGQPEQCPTVTLVHGDAKPGNFAFVGAEVSAVFDWELAQLGDPLADLGWAELLWTSPGYFTSRPSSLGIDDFVARHEALTGIVFRHRAWYRALAAYKMAVILLVGGMMFEAGDSDDLRLAEMSLAIPSVTRRALQELGVTAQLEDGPVSAGYQRVAQVRSQQSAAR